MLTFFQEQNPDFISILKFKRSVFFQQIYKSCIFFQYKAAILIKKSVANAFYYCTY